VQADRIIVNSKFTAAKFLEAFKSSASTPAVLYPGVEDKCKDDYGSEHERTDDETVFFSLQRFDRKKRIDLAVEAFAEYMKMEDRIDVCKNFRLVIAGGYDKRVAENREYLAELQDLCVQHDLSYHTAFSARLADLSVGAQVLFLPSISEQIKVNLFKKSHFLLFTSPEEHFGLVPVEAQMFRLPVIAVDAGGPKETILNGVTGFLVRESATAIAECMSRVTDKKMSFDYVAMGQSARSHALNKFGMDIFGDQLERILHDFVSESPKRL
jgi:alpha-1,3/alpha-1,6-mannosyltransferase